MRLDKLVVEAAPDWTRGAVQRAIRAGEILVDGKRAAPSFRASAGQRIEYQIKPPKAEAPKPESTPLQIVYEEADALVVNKPAGMTTHPAPGSKSGTLANALLAHCPQIAQVGEPTRPGIVHRLDRGTSGLLAAAKTTRGYEALRPQFADHSTERQILRRCVRLAAGRRRHRRAHRTQLAQPNALRRRRSSSAPRRDAFQRGGAVPL